MALTYITKEINHNRSLVDSAFNAVLHTKVTVVGPLH